MKHLFHLLAYNTLRGCVDLIEAYIFYKYILCVKIFSEIKTAFKKLALTEYGLNS